MNIKNLQKLIAQKNPSASDIVKKDYAFRVGKNIEEARILKGITQKELAEMIGSKQPSIARVESGAKVPTHHFLKRIADALGTYVVPPTFGFLEEGQIKPEASKTVSAPEKIIISPFNCINGELAENRRSETKEIFFINKT